MVVTKSNGQQHSNGFALVEILIAILILGTSFVVLLSLQSSAVRKAIRDRNHQDAMLVARSIMSAIEVDPTQLEEQTISMPAEEMLKELLGGQSTAEDQDEKEFLNKYMADLVVEKKELQLPKQEPMQLKKVSLRLTWGTAPDDQFETIFYVQGEPDIG